MRSLQNENQIQDAGASMLVEGLKVNSSLQDLYLVRVFVRLIDFGSSDCFRPISLSLCCF
jgi:hypothetical protein